MIRHQVQALIVFGMGLALTSTSLALLERFAPDASRLVEVLVLTGANLFVTVMRFVAMRVWIFQGRDTRSTGYPGRSRGLQRHQSGRNDHQVCDDQGWVPSDG